MKIKHLTKISNNFKIDLPVLLTIALALSLCSLKALMTHHCPLHSVPFQVLFELNLNLPLQSCFPLFPFILHSSQTASLLFPALCLCKLLVPRPSFPVPTRVSNYTHCSWNHFVLYEGMIPSSILMLFHLFLFCGIYHLVIAYDCSYVFLYHLH